MSERLTEAQRVIAEFKRAEKELEKPIKTVRPRTTAGRAAKRKSIRIGKRKKKRHPKPSRRTTKLTDVEGFPISPRGRPMARGVTDPLAQPPEDMPQSIQDYFLSSRAIRRRTYDLNTGTLEVIFQTGYGYQFFRVPQSVWINWLKAQSAGRFFMRQIYGHWTGKSPNKVYHPNYNYRRIQ